ncbi:unnamed protein product, partial [Didymodactylos carnosus]
TKCPECAELTPNDKILSIEIEAHYLSDIHQKSLLSFLHHLVQLLQTRLKGYNHTTTIAPSDFVVLSSLSTADSFAVAAVKDCYFQLQKYYETLTTLTGGIQTLSDDSLRLSMESLRHQQLSQSVQNNINQIKQAIAERNSYIAGITPNQEILQQVVTSMKKKIEDLQSISYDGILTWKITDVSEKIADAQSERQTSIYSPPFYSSPTGYKMRIRVYLQGDGNARGTHISVFFVIMRGEYDAILKWPFNFKVTFCLFDQSGQQKHIIDSFRPNINSNSFQRPRNEMNIASGIPKFFPILQDGSNYIQHDIMYIKCFIDFGNISKIILPYALSLDPALPHHVQRNMIQTETERQIQLQQSQTLTTTATTMNSTNNNDSQFLTCHPNNSATIIQDDRNFQYLPLDPKQRLMTSSNQTSTLPIESSPVQQYQQQNQTAKEQSPPSKKKNKSELIRIIPMK